MTSKFLVASVTVTGGMAVGTSLVIADMVARRQASEIRYYLEKDGAPEVYLEPIRKWESKPLISRVFSYPRWD
jgi:hypothetical protein